MLTLVPVWSCKELKNVPGYLEILETSFIVAEGTLHSDGRPSHLKLCRSIRP